MPVRVRGLCCPTPRRLADTGIDPVVQGGTLEELLTGRPYEDIEQDPRWGQSLAVRDGGQRLVLTLTDGLVDALAAARRATRRGGRSVVRGFADDGAPSPVAYPPSVETILTFALFWILSVYALFWIIRLGVRYGMNDALRMNRGRMASDRERDMPTP